MYLNSQQINAYLGTGEKNADGDDLRTFLEKYDPKKYDNPCNTVDTIVFTYKEMNHTRTISKVLLIKRGNHPSIGWWALPGGFVEYREDIDQAALRELKEETGIDNIEVEQLKSYGAYDRDPRTRIITTAYVALVPEGSIQAAAGDDAADSGWFTITDQCMKDTVDSENRLHKELHHLVLKEESRGLITETDVEITEKLQAIFKNRSYHVVKTNLLAADHGAVILEGYHYALQRIKEVSEVR